jgi:hypothetical protein
MKREPRTPAQLLGFVALWLLFVALAIVGIATSVRIMILVWAPVFG